jgi:hypothetical protein
MDLRQKSAYCRIESVSVIHGQLAASQPKRQIHVWHRSSLFSQPQAYNTLMTDQVIVENYFWTSEVTAAIAGSKACPELAEWVQRSKVQGSRAG